MMAEKWLTVAEAGHALGIAERTLRRRITEGKVKSKLENNRRLVFVEVQEEAGPEQAQSDMPEGTRELVDQLKQENEYLREELRQTRERSDTIILRLTQQNQLMLEDKRASWWHRWFKRKTPRAPGGVMDMEPDTKDAGNPENE